MNNQSIQRPQWDASKAVALVSGGARGIGRGIVRALVRSGACVVFGDRDISGGQETVRMCEPLPGCVIFRELDFADPGAWPEMVAVSLKAGWTPSLGVSNVGIAKPLSLDQTSLEAYAEIEAINQRSGFLMAQTLAPTMNLGGALIYIGSIMSEFGAEKNALYGMTKSGLTGLVRSLAQELAVRRITVNCIQPGFIALDPPAEFRKIVQPEDWTCFSEVFEDPIKAAFEPLQPLPFAGVPEDIAQAVLFLASESGRFVTGSVLRVDGGAALRMKIPPRIFPECLIEKARSWQADHPQV